MTAGPYSGGTIPWGPQFYYKDYKMPPTVETPDVEHFSLMQVWDKLPEKPDLVIQAGDVFWLDGKPPVKNIIIATDPHCVNYHPRLVDADYFVSMQDYYIKEYTNISIPIIWMPYAYDNNIHKKLDKKIFSDVVMCGLQYSHRVELAEQMRKKGLRVFSTLGLIYDDYVKAYNAGAIALSYSSKQDLPARFWEGLAMGRLVLQNRVPDLEKIPLKEGVDYIGFSSINEAVEKAVYYTEHKDEAEKIALSGYEKVKPHTYTRRVKKLLEKIC
jgi:hypothetical protein